jgi:hypothetical protein
MERLRGRRASCTPCRPPSIRVHPCSSVVSILWRCLPGAFQHRAAIFLRSPDCPAARMRKAGHVARSASASASTAGLSGEAWLMNTRMRPPLRRYEHQRIIPGGGKIDVQRRPSQPVMAGLVPAIAAAPAARKTQLRAATERVGMAGSSPAMTG